MSQYLVQTTLVANHSISFELITLVSNKSISFIWGLLSPNKEDHPSIHPPSSGTDGPTASSARADLAPSRMESAASPATQSSVPSANLGRPGRFVRVGAQWTLQRPESSAGVGGGRSSGCVSPCFTYHSKSTTIHPIL